MQGSLFAHTPVCPLFATLLSDYGREEQESVLSADIFLSILEYAKDGTIPDFSSHALKSIFPLIKSRIDTDKQKYTEKCEKNELNAKYKAYKAKRIEAGNDYLEFEEWKERMFENGR